MYPVECTVALDAANIAPEWNSRVVDELTGGMLAVEVFDVVAEVVNGELDEEEMPNPAAMNTLSPLVALVLKFAVACDEYPAVEETVSLCAMPSRLLEFAEVSAVVDIDSLCAMLPVLLGSETSCNSEVEALATVLEGAVELELVESVASDGDECVVVSSTSVEDVTESEVIESVELFVVWLA